LLFALHLSFAGIACLATGHIAVGASLCGIGVANGRMFRFQACLAGIRGIFLPLERDSPRHIAILPAFRTFLPVSRLAQGRQEEGRTNESS
jgi:hypothetical protein